MKFSESRVHDHVNCTQLRHQRPAKVFEDAWSRVQGLVLYMQHASGLLMDPLKVWCFVMEPCSCIHLCIELKVAYGLRGHHVSVFLVVPGNNAKECRYDRELYHGLLHPFIHTPSFLLTSQGMHGGSFSSDVDTRRMMNFFKAVQLVLCRRDCLRQRSLPSSPPCQINKR